MLINKPLNEMSSCIELNQISLMSDGLTPTEKMVVSLCEQAFFKLWTHPNPKGKKGKELCDCLIVCGNEVIIISVKECNYNDTDDENGWERWHKDAVEKSARQIYGAERFLKRVSTIERSDGRIVSLPDHSDRHYHRLSVSLGSRAEILIPWGDMGKGFIHLYDERGLEAIFGELDTISDFTLFLKGCESLSESKSTLIFNGGGVQDLLAFYVMNDQSFDVSIDSADQPFIWVISDDMWEQFKKSEKYKMRKEALMMSRFWDRMIEIYTSDLLTDDMLDLNNQQVTDNQLAFASMALQPRSIRLSLSELFLDIIENKNLERAARAVRGYQGTAFVFMLAPISDRKRRSQEISRRCLVVRGLLDECNTVVGIVFERPEQSHIVPPSDIAYVHIPDWNSEYAAQVAGIQEEFGYFLTMKPTNG